MPQKWPSFVSRCRSLRRHRGRLTSSTRERPMTSPGIATYVGTAERLDHGEHPGMREPRGMPWHGIVRSGGMRQQHRPSSGCATSAKMTSTMETSIRYLSGWRASSMIGMMFVRDLATLMRSRPDRCENSTA